MDKSIKDIALENISEKDKERFLKKTKRNEETGCLEWQAYTASKGYGHFGLNGQVVLAHRFSYTLFVAGIPEGKLVMHSCDNPKCVEPSHLLIGTNADNMKDMTDKGRANRLFGEDHSRARFSKETIDNIIEAKGFHADIAKRFGCSASYVGLLKNGLYRKKG